MNKKQLIIAALATVFTVSAANATNITGITGNGNVYNIDPAKVSGDVGYRYYDDFTLSSGDIANLIYHGTKNGAGRDISAFINLVQNQIDINGVLNTVRDGSFYNGHAIFISPNGMTVGASGVLNVGQLSVITPTSSKFDELNGNYKSFSEDDIKNLNQVSQLRNGSGMNYGGNAAVTIDGIVIARDGVDVRGSSVNIGGNIINGYNGTNVISETTLNSSGRNAAAQAIFDALVNTDGTFTSSANTLASNGSGVVIIKSGEGSGGINVSGTVANLNNTETAITNHGTGGLKVSGNVTANDKLSLYNNNSSSALTVSGNVTNSNNTLSLSNNGKNLEITSTGKITTDNDLSIVNNGAYSNSQLILAGSAVSEGKTDIVNRGAGGMSITGTVGDSSTTPTVRIVNEAGKLAFSGTANAAKSVSLRNQSTGSGMEVSGTINAGEGVLIHNKAGDAYLNGTIQVTKGVTLSEGTENAAIAVYNEGSGKLTTGTSSKIISKDGNIAIKNAGTNGMALNGTITNYDGETAINNMAGDMTVAGTITNTGNMGIHNREGAGAMTLDAKVKNTGELKLSNKGDGGFTVNGNITNNDGNVKVYNYNGDFGINGNISNTNGQLFVYSTGSSNGLTTGADSTITNTNGDLAIKHNGTGENAMGRGLDLNGTITKDGTDGELAINNYNGDMYVAGTINTNAATGIVNRTGGDDMVVDAAINSTNGKELRIKNETGTGDITVNGVITHNGRLNILNNDGTLTLGGTINNEGSDRTYAIARSDADGIVVTSDFNASSTDGMIYILNKVGSLGLDYAGTAQSTNGQVEIYNMAGNMTVSGTLDGSPAVILNKGDKLTVTDTADFGDDFILVNKGTEAAEIADKYKDNLREQLSE